MFKNFHNSLNILAWSISIQFTLHNSLLHLLSNFQNTITPQNIPENCNNALFNALECTVFLAKSVRTLTHFIFTMNVRSNYDKNWPKQCNIKCGIALPLQLTSSGYHCLRDCCTLD